MFVLTQESSYIQVCNGAYIGLLSGSKYERTILKVESGFSQFGEIC